MSANSEDLRFVGQNEVDCELSDDFIVWAGAEVGVRGSDGRAV